MPPASVRDRSPSIPSSAHALQQQKVEKLRHDQEAQQPSIANQNLLVGLTVASIALVGALAGMLFEKFLERLRGSKDGETSSDDESDSDELIDDELAGAIATRRKAKRDIWEKEDIMQELLSSEFLEFMDRFDKDGSSTDI